MTHPFGISKNGKLTEKKYLFIKGRVRPSLPYQGIARRALRADLLRK